MPALQGRIHRLTREMMVVKISRFFCVDIFLSSGRRCRKWHDESPAIGLTRISVGSVEVESYRFDSYRNRSILLAESDFDYGVCV